MSLTPQQHLRAYVDYLRDLGIYDLYRRENPATLLPESVREAFAAEAKRVAAPAQAPVRPATPVPRSVPAAVPPRAPVAPPVPSPVPRPPVPARATEQPPVASYFDSEPSPLNLPPELAVPMPKPVSFDQLAPLPTQILPAAERPAALEAIRADIGDCTRCPLAYAGRHTIVFADGDPNAKLMFVGEGPGADEDASGLPFVGKAGQLLNNMIKAMGLQREEVYIANIVKCRPPGNRTPEPIEANTCSQFLLRQIDIVRPQVIVALGGTAATYLLGVKQSLSSLRGRWHSTRGSKLVVTYHPAFLLRDPRQKGEAWKDLQMVMAEMGLKPAAKA
ncbi:uracil-DNA glycosylase [Granulicella mallensis]|uniref:Type-4 uracil-DNA glycosylase n=1 Tax=Granulicella mallensis (strain ATCC BAA-1857 / DSM 23137 / MP5ACTX8) TaxID=682795 RepID=G8NS39_GRAMM|nr:uracil-DNA glycosylase [Granulicella mallensis]AEU36247.1 phage SPO1 DNA polymerase-related protein [Granulicella mallensis MP5ACTX8]